jgi:Tol biopolymer transport system component
LSLSANNSIYFGSKRKGRHGIWVAPFVNNTWPRVEYVHLAADPGISPDESFMVFTAMNQPGGYGLRDLYLTLHLPDGTWSKPRNLGPRINSAYFECTPRISPDKKYLFFTRANGWGCYGGPGDTGDIYWVALKEYLPESYR